MPRLDPSSPGIPRTRSGRGMTPSLMYYYNQCRNRVLPRRFNLKTISILLIVLFVIRNLLFRDYRSEQLAELQARGMTPEQIEQILPSSKQSQQEGMNQKSEIEHIKSDVAMLFLEVRQLRSMINGTGGSAGAGSGGMAVVGPERLASGGGGVRGAGIGLRRGAKEGMQEALGEMDRLHEEKRRRRDAEMQEQGLDTFNRGSTGRASRRAWGEKGNATDG